MAPLVAGFFRRGVAPCDTGPVIELFHVGKVYPDGERAALVDVNLCIAKGEFVVLAGPSGAGKTSLLDVLAGRRPLHYRGRLALDGVPCTRATLAALVSNTTQL